MEELIKKLHSLLDYLRKTGAAETQPLEEAIRWFVTMEAVYTRYHGDRENAPIDYWKARVLEAETYNQRLRQELAEIKDAIRRLMCSIQKPCT